MVAESKPKRPNRAMMRCMNAMTTILVPGSPLVETESNPFISQHEGEDVTLTCKVKDKGDHTVSWMLSGSKPKPLFHGTMRVHLDKRYRIESDGNSTYNLKISRITRYDEGKYLCQVNTMPQPTSVNITLQVVVAPEIVGILPQPGATPTIEKNNSNRFAYNESDDVMLTCLAEGSPLPRITWRLMVNTSFYPVVSTNATLNIPNIQRDQAGVFTCTAENGYRDTPKERWITVIVQFKPEVTADERDIRCGQGDYRQLRCQVRSQPPAIYTWTKDNQILTGRDISKRSQMLFVLVSVNPETDYGVYRCQATNILGTTEDVIEVSGRLRPPNIVSNPIGIRRHSYKLVWTMGSRMQQLQGTAGYTPIDGYTMSYYGWWFQEKETGGVEKVNSHSPDSPLEVDIPHDPELGRQFYVLRDLRANVTYEVTLRGYNGYGDGDNVTFTFYTSLVNSWVTTTAAPKKTIASKGIVKKWKNAGPSVHCARADTILFVVSLWIIVQYL
ncbi:igLON family member 5-like [Patiria miniata]|uniref:Ig-like domain-containing protein n=1 Tax=Patiria miniata TaxID=46514 RepID=A0A914AQX3_PATMI|nr:igLON family member 5-like [Patiria miniata]